REVAEHNLSRSRVKAPYNGQINSRKITVGTYLEEKTVIGTMANTSRLRLVGYVPEGMAPQVRKLVIQQRKLRTDWLRESWARSPWEGLAANAADAAGEIPGGYFINFELRAFPRREFKARVFFISN